MDIKPFVEGIDRQKLKVEGVIVYQRGKELARYRWIQEVPRIVFSVSKSFTSTAIGMAIDEGKLKLSDRVCSFFPREKKDERWERLTLENLLTMTMGSGAFNRPASVEEALSHEIVREPGTVFRYDNTCTFLASAMLTKATGLKTRDYLVEKLFRPLGIPDPDWEESSDGYTIGATGLKLTTSSLALFGRFLLQKGSWEGKQLVSPAWLEAATRTQVHSGSENDKPDWDIGYGYQFWTCRYGAYRCDGKDGQYVVVFPALDAVVTINADEENQKPIIWAVWDYILPALRGNSW